MDSATYRQIARDRLQGNWKQAILATLLATLLGGLLVGTGFNLNVNLDEEILYQLPAAVKQMLAYLAGFGTVLGLVHFIIGGVIRQGYCLYLLKQHDGENAEVNDLFSQFHRFGDGFCLALLQGLYIALWSLLFIIPGIIAGYRYAMAPFVLLENPDMTASEAIEASKQMMQGHKTELFLLDLSFIGWDLLCVFTLGIGHLWLNPYRNAAYAAFFRSFRRM